MEVVTPPTAATEEWWWFDRDDALIHQIGDALIAGNFPIAAVSGTRGEASARIAEHFASEARTYFPGGIFVVTPDPPPAPATPLSWIPRELMSPGTPRLLIVRDLDIGRGVAFVADLVSQAAGLVCNTRMLVTSLDPLPLSGDEARQLKLGLLSRGEVRDLLSRRAGVHQAVADAIFERLGGHAVATGVAADLITGEIAPTDVVEGLQPFSRPTILGPDGNPLTRNQREYRELEATARGVSDQVLSALAARPNYLHELPPRRFEEVIAEILMRRGYEVELTPPSGDGGFDLYVAHKSDLGSFLYLVECKRYAPDRPVGVAMVRHLHGVVQAKQATGGVMATSSYFTRDAQTFQRTVRFQLSLRDYLDLHAWLIATATRSASSPPGTLL